MSVLTPSCLWIIFTNKHPPFTSILNRAHWESQVSWNQIGTANNGSVNHGNIFGSVINIIRTQKEEDDLSLVSHFSSRQVLSTSAAQDISALVLILLTLVICLLSCVYICCCLLCTWLGCKPIPSLPLGTS